MGQDFGEGRSTDFVTGFSFAMLVSRLGSANSCWQNSNPFTGASGLTRDIPYHA
jgi:hypothetical protein